MSNTIPLPSRPDSLKILSRAKRLGLHCNVRISSTVRISTPFFASAANHGATFIAIDTVVRYPLHRIQSEHSIANIMSRRIIKPASRRLPILVSSYLSIPPKWQHDTVNEVITVGQSLDTYPFHDVFRSERQSHNVFAYGG